MSVWKKVHEFHPPTFLEMYFTKNLQLHSLSLSSGSFSKYRPSWVTHFRICSFHFVMIVSSNSFGGRPLKNTCTTFVTSSFDENCQMLNSLFIVVVSKISIRVGMCWYFQNIDPFFDTFKILIRIEKFWIKVGNTLYKFLDILRGNFATFLRQFLEKLVKNWENFEIIWRNYNIIILGTFWKFLGKYVRQVSFVKQILNYLLKT